MKNILVFMRPRSPILVVFISIASISVAVFAGSVLLPTGLLGGVPTGAPLWAYLPILPATVGYIALYLKTEKLDSTAATPIAMWNARAFVAMMAISSFLAVLTCQLFSAAGLLDFTIAEASIFGLTTARNIFAWAGITACGGFLFGFQSSWIAPLACIFIFEWFGRDAYGMTYWWAFPAVPPTRPGPWIIAAAAISLGWACIRFSGPARARRILRTKPPRV